MLNKEESKIAALIDKHATHHIGFAIYRLPHTDTPHLVIQTSGELSSCHDLKSLNTEKGFVMAPYNISDSNLPIITIKPQHIGNGLDEIESLLSSIPVPTNKSNLRALASNNMSKDDYSYTFYKFKDHLQNGDVDKIVLARSQKYQTKPSIGTIFLEACNAYPRMMVYVCYTPTTGLWTGSTPEILISGNRQQWTTMALAGTQKYNESPIWDDKNRLEQRVVETYITNVLSKIDAQTAISQPYTVRAGNLMHLRTDFSFTTPQSITMGDIVQHLHPTPAVCGRPLENAKQIINNEEPTSRLYYSGIVGWNGNDNEQSHLYVNLRCMMLDDSSCTVFAGGGIMGSSDVNNEWRETEIKMETMKNIIDKCRIY